MIRLHKYYTQTRCSSQRTKSQIPEMTYSSGNSLDYSLTFSAGIDNGGDDLLPSLALPERGGKIASPKPLPIDLDKLFH